MSSSPALATPELALMALLEHMILLLSLGSAQTQLVRAAAAVVLYHKLVKHGAIGNSRQLPRSCRACSCHKLLPAQCKVIPTAEWLPLRQSRQRGGRQQQYRSNQAWETEGL